MALHTAVHSRVSGASLRTGARRPRRRRVPLTTIAASSWLGCLLVLAFLQPFLPLPSATNQDLLARLTPPLGFGGTANHLLGTDHLGRDLLTRILAGTRISVSLALLGMLISATIGTVLGTIAGYRRGLIDEIVSFFVDVSLAVPFIVIALVALTLFGTGLSVLILLLGLSGWEQYARVARANTLHLSQELYVVAARGLGASWSRILFRHILPNQLAPLLVMATLHLTSLVLLESSLSFLGLGVQPPTPSLGNLLGEARSYLQVSWWLPLFPGLTLVLLTVSFNELGDWIRDVTDPRTRQS